MESDSSSSINTSSSSSSNISDLKLSFSNYTVLCQVGRGAFGDVLKCVKVDTKETVAVKIIQYRFNIYELELLNMFKMKNLDQCNIVRFIESFIIRGNKAALVFEILDMTLRDFMFKQRNVVPLDLHEVRSVVQQMATALQALKSVAVIHSDIKLDNIMLVDHKEWPLRVKLIDFGLALPTAAAQQGNMYQTIHYRAPEIILGLPFSEAIDMWSLGVVMAFIVFGYPLLPGWTAYENMQCVVNLLGVPPDHLLKAGIYSHKYFVEGSSGQWRLKTPQEYQTYVSPIEHSLYYHGNLANLENLPLNNLNMVTADERKECIDLLKAMLQMVACDRITPDQVLVHPFITRETSHHSFNTRPSTEPGTSKEIDSGIIQAYTTSNSGGTSGFYKSALLTSGAVTVHPAPTEHPLCWDEEQQENENYSVDCLGSTSDSSLEEYHRMVNNTTLSTGLYNNTDRVDSTFEPREEMKKKNIFRRFLSWMRKTSSCCTGAID